MHHAAFTSQDFRASWQSEPRDYCVDCHAPRHGRGAAGLEAGVACADCHDGLATHPARPATTRSCVPCHDFPVPYERAALQTTAREHAASDYANVPCAACHAPQRGNHRDHRFGRDPGRLAGALLVTPLGFDGAQVSVSMQTRGVGHRFPTGDLYRRVTVQLTGSRGGRIVCDRTSYLQRDWDEHRRSLQAHDDESFAEDTRLGSDPRRIDAPCTEPPDLLRVTVDYARGASAHGIQLARRFEGPRRIANAVPPGVICTNLARHLSPINQVLFPPFSAPRPPRFASSSYALVSASIPP